MIGSKYFEYFPKSIKRWVVNQLIIGKYPCHTVQIVSVATVEELVKYDRKKCSTCKRFTDMAIGEFKGGYLTPGSATFKPIERAKRVPRSVMSPERHAELETFISQGPYPIIPKDDNK